jgi:hypothetical protein
MAVPVPSISCCVLNHHNLFDQIQNALAFNRDTCCHLMLCLWLLPFHWGLYHNTFQILQAAQCSPAARRLPLGRDQFNILNIYGVYIHTFNGRIKFCTLVSYRVCFCQSFHPSLIFYDKADKPLFDYLCKIYVAYIIRCLMDIIHSGP